MLVVAFETQTAQHTAVNPQLYCGVDTIVLDLMYVGNYSKNRFQRRFCRRTARWRLNAAEAVPHWHCLPNFVVQTRLLCVNKRY